MMTTTTDVTAVPEATVAWWIHWLNLAIAAVSFVGVGIHPGWHPPAVLVEIVAPLAIVLAVGSGVVFAVLHHHAGVSNLRAAYVYVSAHADQLTSAATALVPLIERYPAVNTRLVALETAPAAVAAVTALPPGVQRAIDALEDAKASVPAPAAPGPAAAF